MTVPGVSIDWKSGEWNGEPTILSGDIGGTNANLGIVAKTNTDFRILVEASAPSLGLTSVALLIEYLLAAAQQRFPELSPTLGCISAAGPIESNYCTMSNLPWDVDGNELTREFDFPIQAINDFEAISFGVPLLDLEDPTQVTVLPHIDGSRPSPVGDTRLIVGAGTGLGVSVMLGDGEAARAVPSEGGHASFAPFDAETQKIVDFLRTDDWSLEIEDLLSGKGIASLFRYAVEEADAGIDDTIVEIQNADLLDQPRMISQRASEHAVCREAIRLFVKIYGKVCSDFATKILPKAGLFLAGGIVGKNEPYFLEDDQFTRFFGQNRCEPVERILQKVPVHIIRNYNISLLGAANAGWVQR